MIRTGIKDASTVNDGLSLGELGLDSLMNVEIQQTLQRYHDIHMSTKEIRALTFAKLDQLSTSTPQSAGNTASEAISQLPSMNMHNVLRHLCPTEAVVEMNHVQTEATPLFVIPPIEGSVFLLGSVMSKIQSTKVYGFQCTEDAPLTSIPDLASHYIQVAVCALFYFSCVKLERWQLAMHCHLRPPAPLVVHGFHHDVGLCRPMANYVK